MKTRSTAAELRAIGKKFLDELKAQGPTLDRVGKSFVRLGNKSNDVQEDDIEDEALSKSREFRRLRIEVAKELTELNEELSKKSKTEK